MKTIFIATLGTREIQFKKDELERNEFTIAEKSSSVAKNGISIQTYQNANYPDYLCHSSPREAGETILKHYQLFAPVLRFPLIEKALKQISEKQAIDDFYLVYTDQQAMDKNSPQYRKDTLYYKDIIQRYMQEQTRCSPAQLHEIAITHEAVNYDYQYRHFAEQCRTLFDDATHIEHIYLLAQGGIDQINHALTLQLIQAFGSKVHLWQQSESRNEADELQFPHLFLKDLLKQQLMALVEEANYAGALALFNRHFAVKELSNENLSMKTLLHFGSLRMDLLYNEIGSIGKKLFSDSFQMPTFLSNYKKQNIETTPTFEKLFPSGKKSIFIIYEMYSLSRFYLDKADYTNFVLQFAIFIESFCNHFISVNTKYKIVSSESYKSVTNTIRSENPQWMQQCQTILKLSEPIYMLSVPVNICLLQIIAKEKGLDIKTIEKIATLFKKSNNAFEVCVFPIDIYRNNIAHRGIGIKEQDIQKFLQSDIIIQLDKIMGFDATHNPITGMNSSIVRLIKEKL